MIDLTLKKANACEGLFFLFQSRNCSLSARPILASMLNLSMNWNQQLFEGLLLIINNILKDVPDL